MTTETILADEQINEAWSNNLTGMFMSGDQMRKFARDIEQAVLQSPEVQALRKDAERYKYIRLKVSASNVNHLGRPMRQFHFDRLPDPLNNPLKGSVAGHLDDAIDAAMEQQT